MHTTAVILVAAAGLAFCLAAVMRWRQLTVGRSERGSSLYPVWTGLGLLSAALVVSLVEGRHIGFLYGVIGSWAALASVFFLARFLTLPSRGLLVLPIGGMALLVAMAQMAGHLAAGSPPSEEALAPRWMTLVHVGFMATHLAAVLVTGAAGMLWLITRHQLKAAAPSALRMPSLPLSARIVRTGLVVSAALLIGGLATGGVALQGNEDFSLLHGTPLLGLVAMGLLVVLLALSVSRGSHTRSMAWGALVVVVVTASSVVSLLVSPPHA